MSNQCPVCQQVLSEAAVKCECGWELANVLTASLNQGLAATAERQLADVVVIPTKTSGKAVRLPDAHQLENAVFPQPVELQLTQATDLIQQQEFSKAIACINRALDNAPLERRAECLALKGFVLLSQGELAAAEQQCTESIRLNCQEPRTYAWRAASRGEQSDWPGAFEDLHRACELSVPKHDEYLNLMEKYYQPARLFYRSLIQRGHATADTFADRGWVHLRRGKLRRAERDFKRCLSMNIDHRWAALGLALAHRAAGVNQHLEPLLNAAADGPLECRRLAFETSSRINFEAGLIAATDRDLHQLHRLARGDVFQMIRVCRLRAQLGFPIRSIDILTKLLNQHDNAVQGWLVRGYCYTAVKSYALACKDFTRFLNAYPQHVAGLVARAETLLAMKKYQLAQMDVDQAIQLDSNHFPALLLRAKTYLAQGRLNEALVACHAATRVENEASGFAVKADIYHRLCNYTESDEEYSRAIELARNTEDQAEYHYRRGAALYELEHFDAAYQNFRSSCKLRPNHAGSWVWKAAAAARLEKWHTAVKALQTAVDKRPAAAKQYRRLGRPVATKAIAEFDRQESRVPKVKNLHRYRAMAYQFLGDWQRSIKDYTIALQDDPGDHDLSVQRGRAYAQLGQHEDAAADLTRVIQAKPDHHLARYFRAQSRGQLGHRLKVATDLKKAIQLAPNHAKYHLALGQLYLKMGEKKKATRALDRAVVLDPTDPTSYRQRASVYMTMGRFRRAVRDFSHVIELAPGQAEILEQRGLAHLRCQQNDSALEDFEAALAIDPNLPKAYRGRASVLVTRGKYEYVLVWLTKAIHRFEQPRDLAQVLFARGKAFAQMGRWNPAVRDFTAIINLTRNDPPLLLAARHARGLTNVQAGRYDKASKDFKRIRQLLIADSKQQSSTEDAPPPVQQVDEILAWLAQAQADPALPWLEIFGRRIKTKTPTRPAVVRKGIQIEESVATHWQVDSSYDSWVVRTADQREYGPVHFGILRSWMQDGRIDVGMKLLRSDWSKWRRAERLFIELLPNKNNFVEDFPGIQV